MEGRLHNMLRVLNDRGAPYSRHFTPRDAETWLNHSFGPAEAGAWAEIGVWHAGVAAAFRAAGLDVVQICEANAALTDAAGDKADATYASGSPIDSVCHGDTPVSVLIDAAKRFGD